MLTSKKGSITIGFMFFFLAIFLFFMIVFEFTLFSYVKEKNQAIADNLSSSAVLMVDNNSLIKTGTLRIDKKRAKDTARHLFDISYENFNQHAGDFFYKPTIEVYVYNEPGLVNVSGSSISIKHPSVVVCIKQKPKSKMFLLKNITLTVISKSQVRLKRNVKVEGLRGMTPSEVNDLLIFEDL